MSQPPEIKEFNGKMRKYLSFFNKIIIPYLIILSVIPVLSVYSYKIITIIIVYPAHFYDFDPKNVPISIVYEPILNALFYGLLFSTFLFLFSIIEFVVKIIQKDKPYFFISRLIMVFVWLIYVVSLYDPCYFLSWFFD
jgi:hypothetical protein